MMIRAMRKDDCTNVVDIHLSVFQGFFLSFLGPAFLSLLYRAILSDSSGIAFVADCTGSVAGFVAGSTQPSGMYKRLLRKHLFGFAWASLAGFLRKPAILPRLLRAFSLPDEALPAPKSALLMSLAVDPKQHSRGIGKALVGAFLEESGNRGSDSVYLITDAIKNDDINHFYQSQGFSLHHTYTTPEERQMNQYLIQLKQYTKPEFATTNSFPVQ